MAQAVPARLDAHFGVDPPVAGRTQARATAGATNAAKKNRAPRINRIRVPLTEFTRIRGLGWLTKSHSGRSGRKLTGKQP